MIELYRPLQSPASDEIEFALKELVVAHKVIVVEPGASPDSLTSNTPLPLIKEKDKLISEPAAIKVYLKELEIFVAEWRKFQSDTCYLDSETGEVC